MELLIDLKLLLVEATGLTRSELHFVVGILLYISVLLFMQRSLFALGIVGAVAIGNEFNDYLHLDAAESQEPGAFLWDSATDIFWTISPPFLMAATLWMLRRDRKVRVSTVR